MTNNELETQREQEPSAIGASMAWGCQPCTPGGARTAKRVPEQDRQEAGDQATAASPEMSAVCCASCDWPEGDAQTEWMAAMASRCGGGPPPPAEATPAPPIGRRSRRSKGSAGPPPERGVAN